MTPEQAQGLIEQYDGVFECFRQKNGKWTKAAEAMQTAMASLEREAVRKLIANLAIQGEAGNRFGRQVYIGRLRNGLALLREEKRLDDHRKYQQASECPPLKLTGFADGDVVAPGGKADVAGIIHKKGTKNPHTGEIRARDVFEQPVWLRSVYDRYDISLWVILPCYDKEKDGRALIKLDDAGKAEKLAEWREMCKHGALLTLKEWIEWIPPGGGKGNVLEGVVL